MTKVNLTRRLHEPLRFGHPATLCAKDQHTGSVELQDVELARRLYKQEMCWASEQVELWISGAEGNLAIKGSPNAKAY